MFLEIEQEGGLLAYNNKGKLSSDLEASHKKRVAAYKANERTFLGVNRFENPDSKDLLVSIKQTSGISAKVLSKELNA